MLIPLFGTGTQGQAEVLSAQHRINVFVELPKDAEKAQVTVLPIPGMTQVLDLDDYADDMASQFDGPIRAMRLIAAPFTSSIRTSWIAIVRNGWVVNLHKSSAAGDATGIADTYIAGVPLDTTDPLVDYATTLRVDIVGDESDGTFICNGSSAGTSVRSTGGSAFHGGGLHFEPIPSGLATEVTDADAEDATFCTHIGGQVVVSVKDKRYFRYATAGGVGLAWDALDFETPEASPDPTIRVYANRGNLLAFGESSLEFFALSGDPDAPYAPMRGTSQPIGLAAKWSVADVAGDVVFLARTPNGMHQVVRISGYTPTVLSDQQIDSIFNGYDTIEDATALAYSLGGHTFYQINFPTEDKSWVLDITTGVWSQLVGPDGGRHPAEFAVTWNNRVLIGHHTDPVLYEFDTAVHTFNGDEMPREIVTRHFFKDYDRVIVDELVVDFDVGLGNEAGSDPQVMLQISKDNGKSWGTELWQSLGKIGETKKRVVWRRLGQGRDWTFKLRVTDPVRFVIAGAAINAQPVVG